MRLLRRYASRKDRGGNVIAPTGRDRNDGNVSE